MTASCINSSLSCFFLYELSQHLNIIHRKHMTVKAFMTTVLFSSLMKIMIHWMLHRPHAYQTFAETKMTYQKCLFCSNNSFKLGFSQLQMFTIWLSWPKEFFCNNIIAIPIEDFEKKGDQSYSSLTMFMECFASLLANELNSKYEWEVKRIRNHNWRKFYKKSKYTYTFIIICVLLAQYQ